MEPTKKSDDITEMLEKMCGRSYAIRTNHCVRPPIGCGKPIEGFRNEVSKREYQISGLCQECQLKIFGY